MANPTLLHVINSLGRGGAEVLLCNTIRLLPEYEHVVVTLSRPDDLLADIKPLLSACYCLDSLALSSWPKGIFQLRNIIRRHKPLLVHAHLQIAGLLARLACPKNVPLFYTLHSPYGVDAFHTNRLALPLERLAARPHHHLIGVSQSALKDYQQYVKRSGTGDVVFNMVGPEFFGQKHALPYAPGEQLRCVSVGSLKRAKNYLHTLRALSRLKHLPISLDIYGAGGDEQVLKAFAAAEGLSNVRFKGSSDRIAAVLPDYHLYLISSSYEGFGIAPLEAMAVGLPVMASDIPVFREVAGDAVWYFDLNDELSLVQMLSDVVNGKRDLAPLVAAGRQRAYEISHPEAYKKALLGVYGKYT